ncbi:MAG: alpha/beta hydrolase [Actinomycetota bacterium]
MATITTDDGVELHHEITGSGPALLLIHGITESSEAWAPLVPRFATDRTVITYDQRGHGASGFGEDLSVQRLAADADAIVQATGVGQVDVVGHSLGGMVAATYGALFAPRRIVVVDQPLALADFQDQLRAAEPMLRGDGLPDFMAAMFEGMAGPLGDDEQARLAGLRRTDPRVVLGVWGPVLDGDAAELDALVRGVGAGITAPLLALHGIDPGPEYAAWLGDVVASAELELWADHGHYPQLVDTDRFVDRVATWLG